MVRDPDYEGPPGPFPGAIGPRTIDPDALFPDSCGNRMEISESSAIVPADRAKFRASPQEFGDLMRLAIFDENYVRRHPIKRWLRGLGGDGVVAAKVDGFYSQRRALRSRLGWTFEHSHVPLGHLREELANTRADAVLFVPSWQHSPAELRDALAEIPATERPPLAVYDSFDQTSICYAGVIPFIDLYIKGQTFQDLGDYRKPYAGGFVVADWVQRNLNFNVEGWGASTFVPEDCDEKIVSGWNVGIASYYNRMARETLRRSPRREGRPIQLNRRVPVPEPGSVAKWEWYHEYRRFCGLKVAELEENFRLTGNTILPQADYLRELADCQVAFSPFGWGEVCFRDFEAVACGAVLVKPDMSHVRTQPDIYEGHVTYMPVRWDLQDLPDAIQWLVDHPREANQIADNARQRLVDYLDKGGFVDQMESILARLVPSPVASAPRTRP